MTTDLLDPHKRVGSGNNMGDRLIGWGLGGVVGGFPAFSMMDGGRAAVPL